MEHEYLLTLTAECQTCKKQLLLEHYADPSTIRADVDAMITAHEETHGGDE